MSPDGVLPEIVEYPDHPWFIGVQFHPELKSKPFEPHPLFAGFVGAAVSRRGWCESGRPGARTLAVGGATWRSAAESAWSAHVAVHIGPVTIGNDLPLVFMLRPLPDRNRAPMRWRWPPR